MYVLYKILSYVLSYIHNMCVKYIDIATYIIIIIIMEQSNNNVHFIINCILSACCAMLAWIHDHWWIYSKKCI